MVMVGAFVVRLVLLLGFCCRGIESEAGVLAMLALLVLLLTISIAGFCGIEPKLSLMACSTGAILWQGPACHGGDLAMLVLSWCLFKYLSKYLSIYVSVKTYGFVICYCLLWQKLSLCPLRMMLLYEI